MAFCLWNSSCLFSLPSVYVNLLFSRCTRNSTSESVIHPVTLLVVQRWCRCRLHRLWFHGSASVVYAYHSMIMFFWKLKSKSCLSFYTLFESPCVSTVWCAIGVSSNTMLPLRSSSTAGATSSNLIARWCTCLIPERAMSAYDLFCLKAAAGYIISPLADIESRRLVLASKPVV